MTAAAGRIAPRFRTDRLFTVLLRLADGTVSVTAYDTNTVCQRLGHTTLRCVMTWRPNGEKRRRMIFDNGSVGVPAHQCIDSNEAKELAVSLFCLKPGDTDADFFVDYTAEQLAWVEAHGEELYVVKCDRFGWDT